MNFSDVYVADELRRIQLEWEKYPASMTRWRQEWEQYAIPPRRALAAWLGDRLIDLGERLQSWSLAAQPQVLPE